MSLQEGAPRSSFLELIEMRVRQSTYNRIRNLSVEEVQGRVMVAGQVASQHMKQMALHGALELLNAEQFASNITVHRIIAEPSAES